MADNRQLVKTIETLKDTLRRKQDKLESDVNIKTINGIEILGPGDIVISTEGTLDAQAPLHYDASSKKLSLDISETTTALGLGTAAYKPDTYFLASDTPVVLYTEQNLTDAQKAQARTNIGAGTPVTSETVRNWGYAKISELNKLKPVNRSDEFVLESQVFMLDDGDAKLYAIDVDDDDILMTDIYSNGMTWYHAIDITPIDLIDCDTYADVVDSLSDATWRIMQNQIIQCNVFISSNNIINRNTFNFNEDVELCPGLKLRARIATQSQGYISQINFNNNTAPIVMRQANSNTNSDFIVRPLDMYSLDHMGVKYLYFTYDGSRWIYENTVYANIGQGWIYLRDKNGVNTYGSFWVNQSNATYINLPIPTTTSELTNDSGYLTDIPVINLCADDLHQEFVAMKPRERYVPEIFKPVYTPEGYLDISVFKGGSK